LAINTPEGVHAINNKPLVSDGANGALVLLLAESSDDAIGDCEHIPILHASAGNNKRGCMRFGAPETTNTLDADKRLKAIKTKCRKNGTELRIFNCNNH